MISTKLSSCVIRRISFFSILCLCILFAVGNTSCTEKSATPNDYQLYIEPDAGRQPMLDAINHAQQEIDVVMYLFTDKRIAWALKNAAKRGVTVKLLLEKTPYQYSDQNQWLQSFFQHTPNLSLQWVPYNDQLAYYHEKILLSDHHIAYIMTLNFTHSSFQHAKPERNFILRDQNPIDISEIQNIFNADVAHQSITSLPSNTHIVLSPNNSREQILHFIQQAHINLKIYAIGLSDYRLIGAIAKAAKQGVQVSILWDGKLNDKAATYLKQHGVILQQISGASDNHAKLMVRDDQAVYLGSTNFTENSLDHNRELGVIVANSSIAKEATTTFEEDWHQAQSQPLL